MKLLQTFIINLYCLRNCVIPILSVIIAALVFTKKFAGGLRSLAYSIKGDPFATDPGCWLQIKKEIVDDHKTCLNKTG